MMLHTYPDARSFLAAASSLLERDEALNNLMLSIAAQLIADPQRYGGPPYLATVVGDDDGVVAAALQTPPWNLVLTRVSMGAMELIADDLAARGADLPGVLGPVEASLPFAQLWAVRAGKQAVAQMSMRVFQLTKVIAPRPVPGVLRRFRDDELALLRVWVERFYRDAHLDVPVTPEHEACQLMREGRVYLWEVDATPVAMVSHRGDTTHGAAVSLVYTPPGQRRRGYASMAVATLSQALLDRGKRACFLFTDEANPTSNHIYQELGYRMVGRFVSLGFVPKGNGS